MDIGRYINNLSLGEFVDIIIHAGGLVAVFVSGGKIGYQIEVAPEDLRKAIPFDCADLIK